MDFIKVRPATPADAAVVYAFLCDLEKRVLDEARFRLKFESLLLVPRNQYLTAVVGHEVIGFLSCHYQDLLHHDGPVWEIQELYVQEAWRGKRVGQVLLQELERRLATEKVELLEVSSRHHRQDAHRFYTQNGFEATHLKFTKTPATKW